MSDTEAGASNDFDEDLLRRELRMDEEGMRDNQKIDALFSNFLQWLEAKGQRGEEIAAGYEKLVTELDILKLNSQRSAEAQRANARQIEELDKMFVEMEKEVVELKREIAEKNLQLQAVRKAKMNKTKYNPSEKIPLPPDSALPDRTESTNLLKRIEKDIKALKLHKDALQKKSDEREKHIQLLMTAAHELKYKFRKELEDWENTDGIESD